MTLRITKGTKDAGIIRSVEQRSGVDLGACYQCMKCTSGCPVTDYTASPPSEIMRRLHLGSGEEILVHDLIWLCASCETCSARCPMGIDIARVMDTLRAMALEKKVSIPEGNMPLFNRAFLETVRLFGRTYDIAMIAAYKIGTLKLFSDMEKFPVMLKKRKIAILPPRGADAHAVKHIFKKTVSNKKKR